MAIFGWDSSKQAALYTKKARQPKLAESSMAMIEMPAVEERRSDAGGPLSEAKAPGGTISGEKFVKNQPPERGMVPQGGCQPSAS